MIRLVNNEEFDTLEVMQYAIAVIDKLGYVKNNCTMNGNVLHPTKCKVLNMLEDFDNAKNSIKFFDKVDISNDDIHNAETELLAETVLQYFSNRRIKKKSLYIETDKRLKELSHNVYVSRQDIGMICYMYELYCRINKLGKYTLDNVEMVA